MRIVKQKDGTYELHFNSAAYLLLKGYADIDEVKRYIRRSFPKNRVVFIHLLPRTWWVVKW